MLLTTAFGITTLTLSYEYPRPWPLHYENEGGGDGDGGNDSEEGDDGDDDGEDESEIESSSNKKKKDGKFMTQEQLDRIVEQRLNKERSKNRKTLQRLQQMEQSLKMSDDEREQLQKEIEELEKRTMSADEIRKREEKRAQDRYQQELQQAKQDAETWKQRHDDLKINYEINTAAQQNGVLPQSLPLLTSYLKPQTKLVEETDDEGEKTGKFATKVDFEDRDDEGNVIEVQMSVGEVVNRMRELPDYFGNLFDKDRNSGLGGQNGKAPGSRKDGYRPGMSMQEYLELRKKNPGAIYGD